MKCFCSGLRLVAFYILIAFVFITPKQTYAVSLSEILSSPSSVIVKVQEGFEYFFAFRNENKVKLLEKHAEKRLVKAQGYIEEGNHEKVQNMIQNYQQIKERQNNLLEKMDSEEVLDIVTERTIEQQKTMEVIKTGIDENTKENVVQVQEQVVNQVAKRVVEVSGQEKATGFLNEVVHVWAPGTGPGNGEAGVIYEGGSKLIFAPGTSGGGPSQPDIKTTEVKTGGGPGGGGPGNQ